MIGDGSGSVVGKSKSEGEALSRAGAAVGSIPLGSGSTSGRSLSVIVSSLLYFLSALQPGSAFVSDSLVSLFLTAPSSSLPETFFLSFLFPLSQRYRQTQALYLLKPTKLTWTRLREIYNLSLSLSLSHSSE